MLFQKKLGPKKSLLWLASDVTHFVPHLMHAESNVCTQYTSADLSLNMYSFFSTLKTIERWRLFTRRERVNQKLTRRRPQTGHDFHMCRGTSKGVRCREPPVAPFLRVKSPTPLSVLRKAFRTITVRFYFRVAYRWLDLLEVSTLSMFLTALSVFQNYDTFLLLSGVPLTWSISIYYILNVSQYVVRRWEHISIT